MTSTSFIEIASLEFQSYGFNSAQERLAWAREIASQIEGPIPRERPEIYASEQIYLHEQPEVEIKLQAVRIGDLGITAIPNEVYGITGLKLKAYSPLQPTFNIELANGAQGYIPPPEQHVLGGYTTWPARTAGLEVQAEPKIVARLIELLEKVADKPRRELLDPPTSYTRAVLASDPAAYWRLGELEGVQAADVHGRHPGSYEPGVAFFLPGSPGEEVSTSERGNRCAHFAGGRMRSRIKDRGHTYSVEFWCWNGLPTDARAVTGYLFSRGADGAQGAPGDHLGIGGTHRSDLAGRLVFFNGNQLGEILVGKTPLQPGNWYHVALTRDGRRVDVYLNGQRQPEISGEAEVGHPENIDQVFFGGRSDNLFNLEGKLDEVAFYTRLLSPDEIAAHYQASGYKNAGE